MDKTTHHPLPPPAVVADGGDGVFLGFSTPTRKKRREREKYFSLANNPANHLTVVHGGTLVGSYGCGGGGGGGFTVEGKTRKEKKRKTLPLEKRSSKRDGSTASISLVNLALAGGKQRRRRWGLGWFTVQGREGGEK
ncbi:hypothetical protein L6452_32161 [Arctium lappa]|uniref:Uncharacterized protein n=1 Tax=Arctium lappa TaxID=4217 RepID=A0ACB8Z2X4_ARCLA|nr:hypothetical protein L6452_32161 [Arctium lappa]